MVLGKECLNNGGQDLGGDIMRGIYELAKILKNIISVLD